MEPFISRLDCNRSPFFLSQPANDAREGTGLRCAAARDWRKWRDCRLSSYKWIRQFPLAVALSICQRCSKDVRALAFCCDYIINMAASCTNADVLATVIQKLGGLITCGGSVSAMGKKSTSISTNSRPVKRATPKCSTRHFKISHRKCLSFELYLFHPIDCFVSSKTHSTVSLTVPLAD